MFCIILGAELSLISQPLSGRALLPGLGSWNSCLPAEGLGQLEVSINKLIVILHSMLIGGRIFGFHLPGPNGTSLIAVS